jgi:hypothetical protein
MKFLLVIAATIGLATMMLAAGCGDDDDEAEAGTDDPPAEDEQGAPEDEESDGDVAAADNVGTPPHLSLEQDGVSLSGELGNHQWIAADGSAYIADAFAIISAAEPSELKAAEMTFSAPSEPFDRGTLTVFAADSASSEATPEGEQLRWTPTEAGLQTIEVPGSGTADLSALEPGEYLLSFFGNWDDLGYAEYGFYVVIA